MLYRKHHQMVLMRNLCFSELPSSGKIKTKYHNVEEVSLLREVRRFRQRFGGRNLL